MELDRKPYDIIGGEGFTRAYGGNTMILRLNNLKHLHNLASPHKIEHATLLYTISHPEIPEISNLKQYFIDALINHMPMSNGNFSIFAVNVGDHWAALVAWNYADMVRARFSDSAGTEMPKILREAWSSQEVARIFCWDKDLQIDIRDYKAQTSGGPNACGLLTIKQITEILEDPNKDALSKKSVSHPDLVRFWDTLFTSDLLQQFEDKEEAKILLQMDSTMYQSESSREQMVGSIQALYHHLNQDYKSDTAEELLEHCRKLLPEGPDGLNESGQGLLLQLKKIPSHLKEPSTHTYSEAAGGGGSEEFKDSTQKPQLLKYNLEDGYEINIYQDKAPYLVSPDGKKYLIISEEKTEEIIGQIFTNPDSQTRIGVLWISGEPHLAQPEEIGYVMVETAGLSYETDH